MIIPPLYSAGWSFGSLEGAAQYPHDSGATAGIIAHMFSGSVLDTGSAETQMLWHHVFSTVYQNRDVR